MKKHKNVFIFVNKVEYRKYKILQKNKMSKNYLIILFGLFYLAGLSQSLQGGVLTQQGQFGSLVAVVTPVQSNCGGVIIHPTHVLTSRQCIQDNDSQIINPGWLQIVAGDQVLAQPSYRRFVTNVTHVFGHEAYNPFTHENDIAVLRVGIPFPVPHNTIEIIGINERVIANGINCQFAGWSLMPGSLVLADKQFVTFTISDRQICNNVLNFNGQITDSMLCANGATGVDVCDGNLGGGLYCNNLLTGILSFGINCNDIGVAPSAFTQARFFSQWIQQQIDFVPPPATTP